MSATPQQASAAAGINQARCIRSRGVSKISAGTFRTDAVKNAFRTVPRHLFLPGVDLQAAYAPKPVVTKRAEDGTAVSSASSPNIVAKMLEQLDVHPGMRVLEIGSATGINAALLAELVGASGSVVTIELDEDLAEGARTGLATAGYHQVEVICGDGALGDPSGRTFDRIIVTAGAIFTPTLLLRSGIGPAAQLQPLGIPVVANRRGVGANLQNHPVLFIGMHLKRRARQQRTLRTVPVVGFRSSSGLAGCPPSTWMAEELPFVQAVDREVGAG